MIPKQWDRLFWPACNSSRSHNDLTAIVRLAVIFCRSGLIRLDADAHSYVRFCDRNKALCAHDRRMDVCLYFDMAKKSA